jgi:hypothetical protein
MTTFPNSTKLLKGGIVLIDPVTSTVRRIIAVQYNPDSISHTLQVQGGGGENGDGSKALRLKGPPLETIKLEVEIDAIDQRHLLQASVTTGLTRLLKNGGLAPNLVEGVALPRHSIDWQQPGAIRPAHRTIGVWGNRS